MGFVDKLKFWKHDDPLDINTGLSFDSTNPGSNNLGLPESNAMHGNYGMDSALSSPQFSERPQVLGTIENQYGPQGGGGQNRDTLFAIEKNLEVISSKMDALKANVDSINQRLINLERMAMSEYEHEKKRGQW